MSGIKIRMAYKKTTQCVPGNSKQLLALKGKNESRQDSVQQGNIHNSNQWQI